MCFTLFTKNTTGGIDHEHQVSHQTNPIERAAIIKDCKASGQKVDIYCEQHGLSRDAYYYWLRKVKEAALTQAGFVELPALTSEQIPAKTIEKGTSAFETQMIIKINEIEFYVNENSSSELISRMLEIIRHA